MTVDRPILVVESLLHGFLLRRLMTRTLSVDPRFYSGDGRRALGTMGRSILVHEGGPVFVVKDARTVDVESAEEIRGMARMVLGYIAHEDDYDVFAFMPQLEVVFFEAPSVLRRYVPEIHDLELELGQFNSAAMLERLLARAGHTVESFYRQLDDCDLDALLAGPQLSACMAAADALFTRSALAYSR